MCFPHSGRRGEEEATSRRRWTSNRIVQALREYHSPLQLRKRIQKKCSGLQTAVHCSSLRIKENIRYVSINASARVQHVTRWVFTLNFTKIFLPLVIFGFLTLLHPHTEIQLGVVAGIIFFIFTFTLATRTLAPHSITEKTSSQECLKNAPALPSTSLTFLLYQQMPLSTASMLWGIITSLHLPANLNYISIVLYANVTGCNVEEALEQDLSKYETLSQFFTRRLREGARPISTSSALVSPSDGKLTYSGPVEGEYLEQVKGVRYSLATFLGPNVPNWPVESDTTSLYQAVVYLSPSDYHRFHSPADWSITHRRHFPGALCSVQPSVVATFPGLFHINERVAFFGTWQHGFMAMVAVGATNVGSIVADFDPELKTNQSGKAPKYEHQVKYEKPISFKKGDDFGYFNFGSTMVVIFEAPSDLGLRPSEIVKMGQPLLV